MSDRQGEAPQFIRTRWQTIPGMFALLAGTLLLVYGCGQSAKLEVYAVEGILTVNGEPAANASLAFHPLDCDSNAYCPVGRTDPNGHFHLTTHSNFDGAPAGDYVVTIVWPDESIAVDECECPNTINHDRLKGLYANAGQSEIRVTVRPSANSFRFTAWRPRDNDAPRDF